MENGKVEGWKGSLGHPLSRGGSTAVSRFAIQDPQCFGGQLRLFSLD